jgi:succinate dehydrogenase/fumarate reductase flavoprotein subunit
MPDLIVAGAGMAGLVAAAHARRRGATVLLLEKLPRAGGSMRLSSGVIWRHRRLEEFRAECPDGDPELQRTVFDRLDADLDWLEALGAPVIERDTGNPRTAGRRFDVEGLVAALSRAAGPARFLSALRELPGDGTPVVLATGGFAASRAMLARYVTPEADHVLIRAAPGATGDGLRLGVEAGATLGPGMEQVYARLMPAAAVAPREFVAAAQLYARDADVVNANGDRFRARAWSEIDVAQWAAHQHRARVWMRVADEQLSGRVAEMVAQAERLGAPVRRTADGVVVECIAGITATLGGLRIDAEARAAPGVHAAGHDAGGIATGGYASGLAAALVLGRIAAESALR